MNVNAGRVIQLQQNEQMMWFDFGLISIYDGEDSRDDVLCGDWDEAEMRWV